jgi:presenilin-like A22 family membrane protease
MIGHMADEERRDVIIEHPNRRKPAVRATKLVVVLLLLISAALMLFVAIGGWSKLQGAQAVLIGYIAVYVFLAFFCALWRRGTLPLSAALAVVLLIFAAIAGPEWYARDRPGYTDPAVASGVLGLATLLLIPIEFLLIVFAMRGFSQDWHVEVERRPGPGGAPA